ncbi:MAG TPA: hypothetical protein PLH37_01990 [bacterium]|nr:hypothetical protein [bacterium]
MLNKKFIQKLKKDYEKQEGERRQIIALSNDVLHASKRVIFSLHRFEIEPALESLKNIEKTFLALKKKFGMERLNVEGSYKAGVEEYVEAKMFYLFMTGAKIDAIKGLDLSLEGYLGGICDLTGELVRLATNLAADGKIMEAKKIKATIVVVLAELVGFDLTGYLRTKYDQAKTNLRKIEQINYELSLRK